MEYKHSLLKYCNESVEDLLIFQWRTFLEDVHRYQDQKRLLQLLV